MRNPQSIAVNEDARLIPIWSIVAAIASFLLVEYYFWLVLPDSQHHLPPLGLRTYFNLSWGLLAALYFLMVGYVSKDAPRRALIARLWIVLRQPEVSRCPACSTHVQSDFHFCPQCDYRLAANCGHCFRTVRSTDQYCTRCGHELAADHMPARLRVLGE
jgi:hypothetical protein